MEPLQRHGSARQLIELYEVKSLDSQTIPSTPSSSRKNSSSPAQSRRQKDKSPIRQSLSKVIGLFKKGTSHRRIHSPSTLHSTPSGSRLAGTLFYLSQHELSGLPVWISCGAALEGGIIRLSYSNPQSHFNSLSIQLRHCSDVRSLSLCELLEEEMIRLPTIGNGKEHRVFELVFDEATEKFAAPSIKDRASWVSSVWDSILLIQESKSVCRFETLEMPQLSKPPVDLFKPLPEPIRLKGLPSLPPPSESDSLNLFPSFSRIAPSDVSPSHPVSPSAIPPIIAHSLKVPPTSPQSLRSASIANLSKRSMVKQRLAQMEKDYCETTPLSPERNRPLSYTLSSPMNSSQALMQVEQCSDTSNSIIDSYCSDSTTAANSIAPAWSRSAVSPITEETHSETDISFCEVVAPLRIDTRDETLYHDLPKQSQPYPDTADLLAAQEVQNSKQTVALNEICNTLFRVDQQVFSTNHTVLSIDQKLEMLRSRTESNLKESANQSNASAQDIVGIQKSLATIQALLSSNVVDAIKRLEVSSLSTAESQTNSPAVAPSDAQIAEVLTLLREQNDKNAQRDLLHTDSVRYLNELNTWLETFVNGGTSQIQVLCTSLQQVLQSLGVVPPADGMQTTSLLQDVQRIAREGELQNQNTAALHASLNNVIAYLNAQGGAPGQPLSTQAIVELMERQQQDHEGLMRLLASDLSDEIKGERLRFVEAMKEATAVNVQAHVEDFKKELKREVQGMAKEVGRLNQEKQSIENQIADLLAFYSKQANNGTVSTDSAPPFERVLSQNRRVGGGLRTPQPSPERRVRPRY